MFCALSIAENPRNRVKMIFFIIKVYVEVASMKRSTPSEIIVVF
jgi:hypothetical protein